MTTDTTVPVEEAPEREKFSEPAGTILELGQDAKARVREDGWLECSYCNGVSAQTGEGYQTAQAVKLHWNRWCQENPNQKVAETNAMIAERAKQNDTKGVPRQSRRGSRRYNLDRPPDPMDEVPPRPGGARGGPCAYFIRPDGATISEALMIYPNGAPMMRNGRDRGNGEYYQARQARKGYIYIGPSLTKEGVKKLAEVIGNNRQDYILFLNEEIQACEQTVREADKPEVRDQARTRAAQFERQRSWYARPFDVDAMIAELDDILKAQKLAALSPEQREAMMIMFDTEVSGRVNSLINRMEKKIVTADASNAQGGGLSSVSITNASEDEDF